MKSLFLINNLRKVFVAIAMSLAACSQGPVSLKFGNPTPEKTKDSAAVTSTSVGFAQVNENVFQVSCKACHSAGGFAPTLVTYDQIKSNLAAIQNQVFTLRAMPKNGSLSSEQSSLLSEWINGGAPEEGTAQTKSPEPPAVPITWAVVQAKVFASCVGCHYTKNPAGLDDLSQQSQVTSSMGSIYFTAVISPVMPPPPPNLPDGTPNPNQLTLAQKDLLHRWITNGMP